MYTVILILVSIWDKAMRFIYGDKPIFEKLPLRIKIESYKYYYNNWNDYKISKKIWKKTLVKEFLPPIDRNVLSQIFNQFDLPKLDIKRYIHINKFQNLPIIDICIFVILLKLIARLF